MPQIITRTNDQAGTQVTDDIVTRLRLLSASQKAHRFGDLLDDWSGEAADEIEHLRNSYFLLKQWKELAIEFGVAACYSTASNQLEEFRRQRCLAIWNMLTELDADNV